jgi:hypothetical protein
MGAFSCSFGFFRAVSVGSGLPGQAGVEVWTKMIAQLVNQQVGIFWVGAHQGQFASTFFQGVDHALYDLLTGAFCAGDSMGPAGGEAAGAFQKVSR